MRSLGDTLHKGRPWAPKYTERPESAEDIAMVAREFLRARFQV